MAGVDNRKRRVRWSDGRWQEVAGPAVVGDPVWSKYQPQSIPVPDPAAVAAHPLGAPRWPAYPQPSVAIDFDNPRTGLHESYQFVDPAEVPAPGCVEYSGYPRNGQGTHVMRQVPIPAYGNRARGDVTVNAQDFIWASDLKAANPGLAWALDGGTNLRTLFAAASDEAKRRGVYAVVVNDLEGNTYAPDWSQGWHTGVHCSPDYNNVRGYVTTGPKVRTGIAPSARPNDTLVSGSTSQRQMMHLDCPLGSNYASIMYFSGIPAGQRVWVANAVFVHPGPGFKDNDGSELFWNGIKVDDNQGLLVERLTVLAGSCGFKDFNPGETFFIGMVRCDDSLIRDCLFDGRDSSGVRRMTSPIGHNGSKGTPVVPQRRVSVERCEIRYCRAGMMTFWLTEDIVTAFTNVYSTAMGGGSGYNGVGHNYEEARKIRSFYDGVTLLGKWSSDTSNPDLTQNNSFWCGISGTALFGGDAGADTVIWEPKWSAKDFIGYDAYGKLAMSMKLNYQSTAGDKAQTVTKPLVYVNGAQLQVYSDVDVANWQATGTITNVSVPAGPGVKINQ